MTRRSSAGALRGAGVVSLRSVGSAYAGPGVIADVGLRVGRLASKKRSYRAKSSTSGIARTDSTIGLPLKNLRDPEWVRKGSLLAPGPATARLNGTQSNVTNRERDYGHASIQDWFGGACRPEIEEETIGPGSYGRTLTVPKTETPLDQVELDEEEALKESWGPGFKDQCGSHPGGYSRVRPSSLFATHSKKSPPLSVHPHPGHNLFEKSPWQQSVDRLTRWRTPNIRPWPDKVIELGRDNPGPIIIESQTPLGRGWNLDAVLAFARRCVSDWKHVEAGRSVVFTACHHR